MRKPYVNSWIRVQNDESGKTWNEIIQYTIALDQENATNVAYMKAAEQSGIPTAFIVGKDGAVEWMGHPMSIDEPIAKVLSDEWDREAALAKLEADRALERAQQEISLAATPSGNRRVIGPRFFSWSKRWSLRIPIHRG